MDKNKQPELIYGISTKQKNNFMFFLRNLLFIFCFVGRLYIHFTVSSLTILIFGNINYLTKANELKSVWIKRCCESGDCRSDTSYQC